MTVNGMLVGLLVCGFLGGVIGALTGHGSILGFGEDFICVDTSSEASAATDTFWLSPHPGVNVMTTGYRLCTDHPSVAQSWWYSLERLPSTATGIVVVLTTFLTLRQAQIRGLYTPGFASKLRFLGWFLVIEGLVQEPVESFAAHKLWHTMADGSISLGQNIGWLELLAGLALLSLARIMRVGSAMREDLEGVV